MPSGAFFPQMLAQPVLHKRARGLVLHRALAGWDTCGLQQGAGAWSRKPPRRWCCVARRGGVHLGYNFYLTVGTTICEWCDVASLLWQLSRFGREGSLQWSETGLCPQPSCQVASYGESSSGPGFLFPRNVLEHTGRENHSPALILKSPFSTLCSVLWTSNREGSGGRCGNLLLQVSADLLIVVWGSESSRNSTTLYVLPGHRPKEAGGRVLG